MSDRIYPDHGDDEVFDLDLRCNGGWAGTYAQIIRTAVEDITGDEGPFGPVEVTYDDGKIARGVLAGFGSGDDVVVIANLAIEVERIGRFRA